MIEKFCREGAKKGNFSDQMEFRKRSNEAACIAKLKAMRQEHLVSHWDSLSPLQQEQLCRQIDGIDPLLFQRQKEALKKKDQTSHMVYDPLKQYSLSGDPDNLALGQQRIEEGKVALVVLAGGQGSRVQCRGPKGCCPITPIKRKTLFQFLVEKVKAASIRASRPLDMALMTSPLNHAETTHFFNQNDYFGLNSKQILFFEQEMLPLLDFSENLFLEAPDKIASGPNGNGGVLRCLAASEIWQKWKEKGIEQINIIPIDNPLADPFDAEMLGAQARMDCEIVIKTALRDQPQENVGVIVEVDGKAAVIEYFEMRDADRLACDSDGQLKYKFANLGLYTLKMSLIERLSYQKLPLHVAKKSVKKFYGVADCRTENGWKFEEFIFDILPYSQSHFALLSPRNSCFAPLKNLYGEDSIDTVRKALLANDRKVFCKITGSEPPMDAIFELSPQFYYPTEELIKKWKGKPFPNEEYIHE